MINSMKRFEGQLDTGEIENVTSCSSNSRGTPHQMCGKQILSSCWCWMFHPVSAPAEDQYLCTDLHKNYVSSRLYTLILSLAHLAIHYTTNCPRSTWKSHSENQCNGVNDKSVAGWPQKWSEPAAIYISLGVLWHRCTQRKATRTSFITPLGKESLPWLVLPRL
jgi:hypothetical protein